jgi:hypothetical protein
MIVRVNLPDSTIEKLKELCVYRAFLGGIHTSTTYEEMIQAIISEAHDCDNRNLDWDKCFPKAKS